MNGTGHLSCLSVVVAFNVGLWKLRFTKTGETIVFSAGRILRILGFELLNPLIWAKGHCIMGKGNRCAFLAQFSITFYLRDPDP